MVALVLSAVAIAAVVYAAGNREGAAAPAMANAGNVAVDNEAARNIDLSTMTPREQFARLNDRVMAAASTGDTATVIQFWPMAQGAYQNLLPGDRDIDTRYHMATLHLLLGDTPSTLALADTIMTESADNLIGWYLRAVVAEYEKDTTAAAEARREFLASFESQMATGQDEYVHHADMLQEFRAEGVLVHLIIQQFSSQIFVLVILLL